MKKLGYLLALMVLGAASGKAQEVNYKVDPVHSTVLLRVNHLGASNAWGRFNAVSGSFVYNAAEPAKSSVSLEIKADSIDTADAKRDQHLRSPDFFNAKQFPVITFKSKSFNKVGEKSFTVEGEITVRGVTKPVTAQVVPVGTGKNMSGAEVIGWDASFTLKRSDFGITYGAGALGEEVNVLVSLEGIKQ